MNIVIAQHKRGLFSNFELMKKGISKELSIKIEYFTSIKFKLIQLNEIGNYHLADPKNLRG